MPLDYNLARECLNETEAELLRIGSAKCNKLRDDTQLSAVTFLLLRATSLLRSMLDLVATDQLDSYDAVRRAYLETWLLAFEFRLEDSGPEAAKWHAMRGSSWSADIRKLETFTKSQGIKAPELGRDYGGLSELAHPTRSAAQNSLAVITGRYGDSVARDSLRKAKLEFEERDLPETLYRFVWLILDESRGLINIEVDAKNLPVILTYAEEYNKSSGADVV